MTFEHPITHRIASYLIQQSDWFDSVFLAAEIVLKWAALAELDAIIKYWGSLPKTIRTSAYPLRTEQEAREWALRFCGSKFADEFVQASDLAQFKLTASNDSTYEIAKSMVELPIAEIPNRWSHGIELWSYSHCRDPVQDKGISELAQEVHFTLSETWDFENCRNFLSYMVYMTLEGAWQVRSVDFDYWRREDSSL